MRVRSRTEGSRSLINKDTQGENCVTDFKNVAEVTHTDIIGQPNYDMLISVSETTKEPFICDRCTLDYDVGYLPGTIISSSSSNRIIQCNICNPLENESATDELTKPECTFLDKYHLLSFSGKRFTGKSESLKLLQERLFNKDTNRIVKECAFAYPLKKKAAKIIFERGLCPGETVETIFDKLLYDQLFKDTHRQLLIDIGMSKRVKCIDYWVRPVMDEIDEMIKGSDDVCPPGSLFCITDQRFMNEVSIQGKEYLGRKDVITHFIRLESLDETRKSRGWVPSDKDNDYSECALDNYHFEHVIRNDGTLDELFENLLKVINTLESDKEVPYPLV